MKPSSRQNKKWRKKNPMIHRSYGFKRGRDQKIEYYEEKEIVKK